MPAFVPSTVRPLALAAAVLLCGAAPAQAAIYTGTWDPAFTASVTGTFAGVGWRVSAEIVVPDACGTTGHVDNLGTCGVIEMRQVNLRFYDLASPATVLETIGFGTFGLTPGGPAPASLETQEVRIADFDAAGHPTLGTSFAVRQASTHFSGYYFSFTLTNQFTGAADPHVVYTTLPPNPNLNFDLYMADALLAQRSEPGEPFGGTIPMTYAAIPLPPGQPYVDPFAPVPEPASWALLAAGLAAVGALARRRTG